MPYGLKDTVTHQGSTLERGTVVDDATGDRLRNEGHEHSLTRVAAGHPAKITTIAPKAAPVSTASTSVADSISKNAAQTTEGR